MASTNLEHASYSISPNIYDVHVVILVYVHYKITLHALMLHHVVSPRKGRRLCSPHVYAIHRILYFYLNTTKSRATYTEETTPCIQSYLEIRRQTNRTALRSVAAIAVELAQRVAGAAILQVLLFARHVSALSAPFLSTNRPE